MHTPEHTTRRVLKNARSLFDDVVANIALEESPDEIRAIAEILLQSFPGISRMDVVAGRMVSVPETYFADMNDRIRRINNHEPVQYVVGEALFYGRTFAVDPAVLIPRPETEELIRTVLAFREKSGTERSIHTAPRIIDIGTGSGCIAVTLAKEWEGAQVYATDVSTAALSTAANNARKHGAHVSFIEHDILQQELQLHDLDAVVSNPPYICHAEKSSMLPNVLAFEPHLALFVDDDDPLLFYKAIVHKAHPALKRGGLLVVEINERFAIEVRELFAQGGFSDAKVVEDIAGKPRVVRGLKST